MNEPPLLVGLAAILWLLVVRGALTISSAGPETRLNMNALAQSSLWAVLAVEFLRLFLRGALPFWSGIVALVLLPLSWASSFMVVQLLRKDEPVRWMSIVPAALPLLVVTFMAWATIPRYHALLSSNSASAGLWMAVLMLILIPISKSAQLSSAPNRTATVRERAVARVQPPQTQPLDQQRLPHIQQLTPTSPLKDWLQLLDAGGSNIQLEALSKMRTLPNRQTDMERMLNRSDFTGFPWIVALDLAPTPGLFSGARRWLRVQSIDLRPTRGKNFRDFAAVARPSFDTLQWLTDNACPMLDDFKAFDITARMHQDPRTSDDDLILARIAAIRLTLERTRTNALQNPPHLIPESGIDPGHTHQNEPQNNE